MNRSRLEHLPPFFSDAFPELGSSLSMHITLAGETRTEHQILPPLQTDPAIEGCARSTLRSFTFSSDLRIHTESNPEALSEVSSDFKELTLQRDVLWRTFWGQRHQLLISREEPRRPKTNLTDPDSTLRP